MLNTKKGTKQQLSIQPHVDNYYIPVTIIHGLHDGPCLLITAGIHSGEYPSIPSTINVAKKINPKDVHGKIIIFHCVNVSGFWAKNSAVLPEDQGNLNQIYPGDPNGSESMRIADFFVQEIFPHVDFILDIHSGGGRENLAPCLFFPHCQEVRKQSLEAAKHFNVRYLIESFATTGEYSYAANYFHIPGILLERGYGQQCYPQWIQENENDIFSLLDYLHIYSYPHLFQRKIQNQNIFTKTIYLTSTCVGLWYPLVETNQIIFKGQKIGYIEDFYGHIIQEFVAKENGIVFYYTSGLPLNKGTALIAYGLLSSIIK